MFDLIHIPNEEDIVKYMILIYYEIQMPLNKIK